jgi:hypothetical protein
MNMARRQPIVLQGRRLSEDVTPMVDGDSRLIRFRLSSLLIAMAAAAAMAALSARAMAFLDVPRVPRNERALMVIALAVVAIVPLAFILVVGLTKACLFGRQTASGERSSAHIDDSGR